MSAPPEKPPRLAIVTVAFGHSVEHLDHTFISFSQHNPDIPLHAFVIGDRLPKQRLPEIRYHLRRHVPDFSHPLREVYFRRLEMIDELDCDIVLLVDSYDVLCLQPLRPFETLLGGADVAACVEHHGSYYVLGIGSTMNFLNGGVYFWHVRRSRDIRMAIVARGRAHFRTIADDQFCANEVIQTCHFDRLRILPCQYNYRAYLRGTYSKKRRGWPTVDHLDGVVIYHNATCIPAVKGLLPFKQRAELPCLPVDGRPLTPREQFLRRFRNKFKPWLA